VEVSLASPKKSLTRSVKKKPPISHSHTFFFFQGPLAVSSRVFNRQSVQEALRSVSAKRKMLRSLPPNGLAIFCGNVMAENKERKVSELFEPFHPITRSLYHCDSHFHVEPLLEQLRSHHPFGIVIMDGNGIHLYLLKGSTTLPLFHKDVSLPKKHGRGGQSQHRFERLRDEARLHYLRLASQACKKHFIDDKSCLPCVEGIILAGHADFKNFLVKDKCFDPRLSPLVLGLFDIQYGGKMGLYETLEKAEPLLANLHVVKEKQILARFFQQLAIVGDDGGKMCFGLKDTLAACEIGAVEKLIVWEGLKGVRGLEDGERVVWRREGDGVGLEDCESLVDWLLENSGEFGCELEIVSGCTSEGSQFVEGFGGIGGVLRWKWEPLDDSDDEDDFEFEY